MLSARDIGVELQLDRRLKRFETGFLQLSCRLPPLLEANLELRGAEVL